MTLDELKRVIACATPVGITADKQVVFSFDALAESAELQRIELTTKRETFAMLRGLGFTDTKSDGERRIAASLLIVVGVVLPVAKSVLAQYEVSKCA